MNKLLKPISMEEFVKEKYWGSVVHLLNDFIESGCELVEVNWREAGYKSVTSAYSSIQPVISRKKLPIRAIHRNEHVYLMRKKGE